MQHTVALARTVPSMQLFVSFLTGLGSTYHALQQWEEARRTLAEADTLAETLELGSWRVPTLSQLCMHCAEAGEWEQAYRYALKVITVRKSSDLALNPLDFSPQYETEALLREGNERKAREEVHRLGDRLGSNRRLRIPYLRSLAALAAWEGHGEQAIDHLREAAALAADLGLPGEQWQIQMALGSLYEAGGEQGQRRHPLGPARRGHPEIGGGIKGKGVVSG